MAAKIFTAFRISAIDQARLKKISKDCGKAPSALVRDIVVRHLDQYEIAKAKNKSA